MSLFVLRQILMLPRRAASMLHVEHSKSCSCISLYGELVLGLVASSSSGNDCHIDTISNDTNVTPLSQSHWMWEFSELART